jgi:hypothetical protein
MPLQINDWPADPECVGEQWLVSDENRLAKLVAYVLLGKARHAARIIHGAEGEPLLATAGLKARLRAQLTLSAGAEPYHRDGMLFESICWIAAQMKATQGELISDPHLQSTQQGTDMLKISFDVATHQVRKATIYEQKCTTGPRGLFQGQVLTAFREYVEQKRDNQIVQIALSLLAGFNLTDEQERAIHSTLVRQRPFAFSAGLTVSPDVYTTAQCAALFKGFSAIAPDITNREGNTFPLQDIRSWFDAFANSVGEFIEAAEDV